MREIIYFETTKKVTYFIEQLTINFDRVGKVTKHREN